MPKAKLHFQQTGASKLRGEPATTSPGRRPPSKSPSRSPFQSPKLRARIAIREEPTSMDFQDECQSSPPKNRRMDDSSGSHRKGRALFSALPPEPMDTDVVMEDRKAVTPEVTEDLAAKVNKMIVTHLGGRRKRKPSRKNDDDESHDDEADALPFAAHAKRHTGDFDLRDFSKVMDVSFVVSVCTDDEVALQILDTHRMNTLKYKLDYFHEWRDLFLSGHFNVLIKGCGSKIRLINAFIENLGNEADTFVVNGFSASVTLRAILQSFEQNMGIKCGSLRGLSLLDYAKKLGHEFSKLKGDIILAIHNIDGPNFRDANQLQALSAFVHSSERRVHLLASVDHVNASLLWEGQGMNALSWVTYTVNTLASYKQELLSNQSSIQGSKSAADSHTSDSLEILWISLQSSAQQVLVLLTTLCIQSSTKSIEVGYLFDHAKQELIATSRKNLEHYLVEYRDHSIITLNNDVIKLVADQNLLLKFFESKGVEM